MVKKLREWNSISTRLEEAQKTRCEKYIREDLRIVKTNNWTKCNQYRFKWKEVFESASIVKQ